MTAQWFKKRKLPPPFEPDACLCGQCGGTCGEAPMPGKVRCEDCHFFRRHPSNVSVSLTSYCRSAAHGDCADREEHDRKLAAEMEAMKGMIRSLDHVLDVAQERKWGQMTLGEASR